MLVQGHEGLRVIRCLLRTLEKHSDLGVVGLSVDVEEYSLVWVWVVDLVDAVRVLREWVDCLGLFGDDLFSFLLIGFHLFHLFLIWLCTGDKLFRYSGCQLSISAQLLWRPIT